MPIPDDFQHHAAGLDSPYQGGVDVTPSDSDDLPFRSRALWIGGAGDVHVQWPDGTTTQFPSVAAGTLLPIRVDRVLETDTTATNIRALK